MRIKEEKGFAGTDIALSVIIVTIFISMIANLIVNINWILILEVEYEIWFRKMLPL